MRPGPPLTTLLDTAAAAGTVCDDFDAVDLLDAIAQLCQPIPKRPFAQNRRLVTVFLDGLPHAAKSATRQSAQRPRASVSSRATTPRGAR